MKYCTKCGRQMNDDIKFCPECGTQAQEWFNSSQDRQFNLASETKVLPKRTRWGMVIAATVYLLFAFLGICVGLSEKDYGMVVGMGFGMFGIMGIMFIILAKSPKEYPNILGRETGCSKPLFVLMSIILSFVVTCVGVFMDTEKDSLSTSTQHDESQYVQAEVIPEISEETIIIETIEAPVFTITYNQYDCRTLFDDINNNAFAAEQKHQDEYVEVSGYVNVIDSGGEYFSIGAKSDEIDYWLQDITCRIVDSDQLNQLAQLKADQKVIVRGQIVSIGEILGYKLRLEEIIIP